MQKNISLAKFIKNMNEDPQGGEKVAMLEKKVAEMSTELEQKNQFIKELQEGADPALNRSTDFYLELE